MNMIPVTQIDLNQSGIVFPEVRVADVSIDQDEIAREIQHHPHDSLEDAWEAAARSLVIKHLLEMRADQLGIINDDESLRLANVLEKELVVPEPDELACERYYQQNKDRFKTTCLLAVRHILLASAPDDIEGRDQGREEAENIINCLKEHPQDFGALALSYSACESKHQAGQLGQISKGQTVAEFERQIKDLPIGLHLNPIESRYGWHVVSIDDRVEGDQLPYEAVKTHIHQMLHESVTRRCLKQYLQVLATEANVVGIDMGQGDSPLMQ